MKCLYILVFISLVVEANLSIVVEDGWTKSDLVYSWYERGPVQIPRNLSLPGGFKLGGFDNQYCDVKTATGGFLSILMS